MTNERIINFNKYKDKRGNLTFIESNNHIPFEIKRVYWIYDVPGGQRRGGHAYKSIDEVIIALSGSFDVILDKGKNKSKITLNRPYFGLYVPKNIWKHLENFSTNSLCLILASSKYDEKEYIRNHKLFLSEFEKQ